MPIEKTFEIPLIAAMALKEKQKDATLWRFVMRDVLACDGSIFIYGFPNCSSYEPFNPARAR